MIGPGAEIPIVRHVGYAPVVGPGRQGKAVVLRVGCCAGLEGGKDNIVGRNIQISGLGMIVTVAVSVDVTVMVPL